MLHNTFKLKFSVIHSCLKVLCCTSVCIFLFWLEIATRIYLGVAEGVCLFYLRTVIRSITLSVLAAWHSFQKFCELSHELYRLVAFRFSTFTTHVYANAHTHTHTYTRTHTHTHTHAYTHTHTHTHMCTCIHAHTYAHVLMHT